ncbi:MAG TPA: GNAT family N-acetyltransferase [archaeon]|nr:GNAT family N-acetyltransferase [archaeon]
MKIEDYPLSSLEKSLWNRLLDISGTVSPFCRYAWLKLVSEANPGWRVGVILALENGGIIGGLPYADSQGRFSRQSHALPWGTPAGVVLAPGADSQVAEKLIRTWAGRTGAERLPCRLSITFPQDNPSGIQALKKLGFSLRIEKSFSVGLAGNSFETWEASLKDSVRNQNRQAVMRGARFQEAVSEAESAELYSLARLTARRHRKPGPLLSEEFYRLLFDPRGPLTDEPELVRVFMVRVQDRPSVFSVCLVHAGRLWLWDYGADESTFAARPNNLMYQGIIAKAFELGLAEVDLGAVPEGASSLEHFKLSFGARPYQRLSAVYASPVFRLGAWSRAFFYRGIRRA